MEQVQGQHSLAENWRWQGKSIDRYLSDIGLTSEAQENLVYEKTHLYMTQHHLDYRYQLADVLCGRRWLNVAN